MRTSAVWPTRTFGTSVSSTSITASTTLMSEIVISLVPALFMVPITAISPSSTGSAVTRPAIGEVILVFDSSSRAPARLARACSMRRSTALTLAAADSAAAWALSTSACGDDLVGERALGALEALLGLLGLGARGVAIEEQRLQRLLGRERRRPSLVLVDLEQEVALGDPIAFAHREVDDLAHHVGREVDLLLRLDLAGGGDQAPQVGPLDLLDGHHRRLLRLRLHHVDDDQADHGQGGHRHPDLDSTGHLGHLI